MTLWLYHPWTEILKQDGEENGASCFGKTILQQMFPKIIRIMTKSAEGDKLKFAVSWLFFALPLHCFVQLFTFNVIQENLQSKPFPAVILAQEKIYS